MNLASDLVTMAAMAAIDDQIAKLEQIVNLGVESNTVDGQTTRVNLTEVRRRLRELYRTRQGRNQVQQIRLSGGFDNY